MKQIRAWVAAFGLLAACMTTCAQQGAQRAPDSSPHRVEQIPVGDEVKVEVLDWGGTGRPLILLAGLGSTAHVFDGMATKLTDKYHVYGMTRRGFGASTHPEPVEANYTADRLADDVLAVMQELNIQKPVIAGHSIAGEELSSIGSRFPDRVAGLIYLDAGYSYAFYDPEHVDVIMSVAILRHDLDRLTPLLPPKELHVLVEKALHEDMPRAQKAMEAVASDTAKAVDQPAHTVSAEDLASSAVLQGVERFGGVKCPVLAIYASPHDMASRFKDDPAGLKAAEAGDDAETSKQAAAFQAANPQARVVKLAHAKHSLWESNEADVLREMNAFIAGLS